MDVDALNKFEWHDLPISRLCISESGIDLVVTPFNDEVDRYDRVRLCLRGASSMRFDVQGALSPNDLSDLEVYGFDYRAGGDRRLSGELRISPGSAGFWTIAFENAQWELKQLPADADDKAAG